MGLTLEQLRAGHLSPTDMGRELSAVLRDDETRGTALAFELLATEPRTKPSRGLVIDPHDRVARQWSYRVMAVVALVDSDVYARVQHEVLAELAESAELARDVLAVRGVPVTEVRMTEVPVTHPTSLR